MVSDPLCIERASHLIIVIKNWERIADMATNIAEEVLYIIEGVSAKHQHLRAETTIEAERSRRPISFCWKTTPIYASAWSSILNARDSASAPMT